jgi:hypothetical protein
MFDAEKFVTAPIVRSTMNREVEVMTRVLPRLMREFTSDLTKRRPKPGDLDLLTFLVAIAGRGTVIVIPEYHATRPTVRKAGELVLPANRHGKITAIVANAKTFRFSIRIEDANVMTTDKIGAPRTFTLTDFNGQIASNWDCMQLLPTASENRFLVSHGLVQADGRVPFTRTVHPNRWTSMFGRSYILGKILLDRLSDEIKHRMPERERRDLLDEVADETDGDYRSVREAGKKIKVQSLEVKVVHDVFLGEYRPTTDVGVRLSTLRSARERLQVATRAVELAYYGAMKRADGWPTTNGLTWHAFKPPKARTTWQYMSLGGDLAIQARLREVTETVHETVHE